MQPKAIKLVPGDGVFRQLDAAIDGANDNPTRLMRNLIGTFFTPEVLAMSSSLGTEVHVGLDQDIVDACVRKYTCACKIYYC